MSVNVVIGSWKAYNECNERAYGSNWLDLSKFSSVEEITEELKNEGFTSEELEETFIQDIEYLDVDGNCDYLNYERLFKVFHDGGLNDENKLKTANAFIEAQGFSELEELIDAYGEVWDDEIYFYENQTIEEVAEHIFNECYYDVYKYAQQNKYVEIDYEEFAQDLLQEGFSVVSNGVIKIR